MMFRSAWRVAGDPAHSRQLLAGPLAGTALRCTRRRDEEPLARWFRPLLLPRCWSFWFALGFCRLDCPGRRPLSDSQEETRRALERLHLERRQKQERLKPSPRESCRNGASTKNVPRTHLSMASTMSLQRIERALRQHGLEVIPAEGETFDPERMEVVEAVRDSGRPAGEVVAEVRRGYLLNGRVFRFSQVRVAKA